MNELIWDLFKQSGIDIGEDQESNIEKFALLITKECITQIEPLIPHIDQWSASSEYVERRTFREAIEAIEKHFGVE